jgi:hypothetical protein
MSEENHKVVEYFRDYAPDGDAERSIRNRFVKMSDAERVQELQNLSSWLKDDSPLRAKASLMKIGRELNNLHAAMRKVNR